MLIKKIKYIKKNYNNKVFSNISTQNNNFSSSYNSSINKISLELNILKNTIQNNNHVYKNNNIIFSNNINYTKSKRNNIKNKIDKANFSIQQEILVLSDMKSIINNHPYNFLNIFESNYNSIPIISLKDKNKISYSLNNIKTYKSKLNDNTANINNISYQSEEQLIGTNSVRSLILGSKSLILSKMHFRYNNILYFSKYLNNLTSFDHSFKITPTSTNYLPTRKNIFIRRINKNYRNKSIHSICNLSTTINVNNYKKYKQYIISSLFVAGVGIISTICAYFRCRHFYKSRNKKKLITKFKAKADNKKKSKYRITKKQENKQEYSLKKRETLIKHKYDVEMEMIEIQDMSKKYDGIIENYD